MKLLLTAALAGTMLCSLIGLMAPSAQAQYVTHGIGNSYSDKTSFVSGQAQTVWADTSGVVFNSYYDEAGQELKAFNSDKTLAGSLYNAHFDNSTATSGRAVAGNASYVWATLRNVGEVGRWNRSGRNTDGKITGIGTGNVGGLAVRGNRLYASDTSGNLVKVYDISNNNVGSYISQFSTPVPGGLTVDAAGNLWVAESNSANVRLYNPGTGQELTRIWIGSAGKTGPISIYTNGSEHLMVADRGSDLCVKIYGYNSSNPGAGANYETSLGEVGGYLAGSASNRGTISNFRFTNISGLSADANGNVYVLNQNFGDQGDTFGIQVQNGGTDLRKFNRTGTNTWSYAWDLRGMNFEGNADVDPATINNGSMDLYTGNEKFTYDPGSGSWNYVAHTIDPFRYPSDPRLGQVDFPIMRRIGGQKVMFVTSQSPGDDYYNQELHVLRFDSSTNGEVAIPTGIVLDAHVGFSIADNGDVYGVAGNHIYYRPFTGTGSSPAFGTEQVWDFNLNSYTSHKRVEWDGSKLYILSYTGQYGQGSGGGEEGLGGRVLTRLRREGSGWVEEARTLVPHNFTASDNIEATTAMAQAGDYLFVAYYKYIGGTESLSTTRVFPKNFANNPDSVLGATITLTTSDSNVFPGHDLDSYYGVRAVKRSNGDYVVLKDDYNTYKVVSYVWNPGGGSNGGGTQYYRIKCRWLVNSQPDYLYDGGEFAKYGALPGSDDTLYQWELQSTDSGHARFRNRSTGDVLNVENVAQNNDDGNLRCTAGDDSWWSSRWTRETSDSGYEKFQNAWQTGKYIHVENRLANAQYGTLGNPDWWSAQWMFEAVPADPTNLTAN